MDSDKKVEVWNYFLGMQLNYLDYELKYIHHAEIAHVCFSTDVK